MIAFILLRRRLPDIVRPYRSPLGELGAGIAAVIALVSLISLFFNQDYRPGVVGTLIWFGLGLVYFALMGRSRLVLSPEEEFALTKGERGHPELGDFGGASVMEGTVPTTGPTPSERPPS
jgi:ethanolamine permease